MEAKKSPEADLYKKSPLFLNIGLIISLALVLFAFEYKSYDTSSILGAISADDTFEETTEIPPTEQPPPPPPKIQQPEIIEIPDEEEIEEEVEINTDTEMVTEEKVDQAIFEEPEEEEEVDEIFTIVEKQPSYPGGVTAFYKYVQKKMKYPSQARRMGIEGKVFVQFVVGKDGVINDVKVIRGVGAGCDEEAVRVIKNSPKWAPGKQRGKAVKVRMVLPITFRLS